MVFNYMAFSEPQPRMNRYLATEGTDLGKRSIESIRQMHHGEIIGGDLVLVKPDDPTVRQDFGWLPEYISAEESTNLIHGSACGAYHARKKRQWISSPPQTLPPKTVSTANVPCPKVQAIQAERPAMITRAPVVGFWGTCAIAVGCEASLAFHAVRRIPFASVQRVAEHQTGFHSGCVARLDARKRIALARNVERLTRTHLLRGGSRKARRYT
jgi:hypothetical protein